MHKFLKVIVDLLVITALFDLAIRSVIRLDRHWDTVCYHLPFAAMRGQLNLSYEMNDLMYLRYQGFPFLPETIQGLLWKVTGSVNMTGIVNYLAFLVFIVFCQWMLRARFGLVAIIALTAPLVIIHTTTNYVDLFGNAFLAIGISTCFYIYLYPERITNNHILWALAGFIAAAWSKYLLVPIVGFGFSCLILACFYLPLSGINFKRKQLVVLFLLAILLSTLPYLKNWILYANPFWPIRVPFFSDWFPHIEGFDPHSERPNLLKNDTQFKLFIHSLFEINHPTQYAYRPRWIIDQGNADIAFRMGGFWCVGVVFYVIITMLLLLVNNFKKGIKASFFLLGLFYFVAILPQSNELRYFLFLPLTWAAIIGMSFPIFKEKLPRLALFLPVCSIVLFGYMVSENWAHYKIEKSSYLDVAKYWEAPSWWAILEKNKVYCAVNMIPKAILLSGPTMREYTIVDRSKESLCPKNSLTLTKAGIKSAEAYLEESHSLFSNKKYHESIQACMKSLQLKPNYPEAYNNICAANIDMGRKDDAISACNHAIELRSDYSLAINNLAWAMKMNK